MENRALAQYQEDDDDNTVRADRMADDFLSGASASPSAQDLTRLRLKILLQRVRLRELVDLNKDKAHQNHMLEEQLHARDKRIEQLQRQCILAESKRWRSDRALNKLLKERESQEKQVKERHPQDMTARELELKERKEYQDSLELQHTPCDNHDENKPPKAVPREISSKVMQSNNISLRKTKARQDVILFDLR